MSELNTLKKSELINAVYNHENLQENKLTKKAIDQVINEIFAAIKEEVIEQKKCNINSFGTFTMRLRQAREGRQPQDTSKTIHIPASHTVGLKVSQGLKASLKAKKLKDS